LLKTLQQCVVVTSLGDDIIIGERDKEDMIGVPEKTMCVEAVGHEEGRGIKIMRSTFGVFFATFWDLLLFLSPSLFKHVTITRLLLLI